MQSNLYSDDPLFNYWHDFDGVPAPANYNPTPPQPSVLAAPLVGTHFDNGSYNFVPPPAGLPLPLGPILPGPCPNPMMGPVHRSYSRFPPPLAPLQTMPPHGAQLQPPPPVVHPTHPFNFQPAQPQFPIGLPPPAPVPVPLPVDPSLDRSQLNDSGQMEQVVVKNGQVFHISFLDEPEEPQPPAQPTPTSEDAAEDEERDWINYDELPLLQHVTGSSNGDGTYKCGICGKELKSAINLYVHEQTHKTTRLDCKICGKRFNRIGKLENHVRRAHPEVAPDRAASPKSSSSTPVLNDFSNYCVECEEFFPNADELQNHMEQNHRLINDSKSDDSVKKSIKCPYCQELFEWPCLLKNHMTKHTGEKPFICERCNVSFRFVQSFYRHNRRVHGK